MSCEDIDWPGSGGAVIERLRTLSRQWDAALGALVEDDLERPLAYPWPEARPLRLAIAWANSELMKNVAEIGSVRHAFVTARRGGVAA